MNAGHENSCPSCGSHGLEVFYKVEQIPVQACVTMGSREEALHRRCRDLALGFCHHCGFISNILFDGRIASDGGVYEDQQTFSPFFRAFQLDVTRNLVERYGIRAKDVLEIGCGKGDFLIELCKAGDNSGLGIDPLCQANDAADRDDAVRFIADYYGQKYADEPCDLVTCRHTLEHIPDVAEFLTMVRRTIGDRPNTIVFFEVPDTRRVLKERAFWDIYYDHCSYFTMESLGRLFKSTGFELNELTYGFGGQYLLLFAHPATQPTSAEPPEDPGLEELTREVAAFRDDVREQIANWRKKLMALHEQGRRIAVWGSGSKCVGFLGTLGLTDSIDQVIDINPHRQGRFVPGIGCQIVAPEALSASSPDVVIVMNPVYRGEIRERLKDMGLQPELLTT